MNPHRLEPCVLFLWSDPGFEMTENWTKNTVRGCSWCFNENAVVEFLTENNLTGLIRAHEAQQEGFSLSPVNEKTGFPTVITIFSAPNYMGTQGNKGAFMTYINNGIDIKQFSESPAPFVLPGFLDAISWSIPFAIEKMMAIVDTINLMIIDDTYYEQREALARRYQTTRHKLKGVAMMAIMFQQFRSLKRGRLLSIHFPKPKPSKPKTRLTVSDDELRKIRMDPLRRPEGTERFTNAKPLLPTTNELFQKSRVQQNNKKEEKSASIKATAAEVAAKKKPSFDLEDFYGSKKNQQKKPCLNMNKTV